VEAQIIQKLRVYYFVAVGGVLLSMLSFSYNAWRLEVTEDNSNTRTAAFEMLHLLAEFEQILYASHYDADPDAGSPRKGWVKVGLLSDLSFLMGEDTQIQAAVLKSSWSNHWASVPTQRRSVDALIAEVDVMREEIKRKLIALE